MPDLLKTQQALKALLLLPTKPETPSEALSGIATERLSVYQSLLRGTVSSCLEGIYPHTHAFLKAQHISWEALVEEFRREHPNPSFMLLYAVEHWPAFLARQEFSEKWPWLAEVAMYEWQEALVQNMPLAVAPGKLLSAVPDAAGLLNSCPAWNTAAILHGFAYPVTRLLEKLVNNHYQPPQENTSPEVTNVLIYRDPQNFKARFFVMNTLTASLLATLKPSQTYAQGFEQLIAETPSLQAMPREAVVGEGLKLLRTCLEKGILLGSVPG